MLASLGGDRDADHLARAALKDQDVTDADKVAGDSDGLAGGPTVAGLDDANVLANYRAGSVNRGIIMAVERVQDAVSSTLHAAAEGVILTFVVVVTHLASFGDVADDGFRDLNLGLRGGASGSLKLDLATSVVFSSVRAGGLGLVGAVVRVVDDGSLRVV